MELRRKLETTRRTFQISSDQLEEKKNQDFVIFTSNGSRNGGHDLVDGHCPAVYQDTDMPVGGGTFAAHPNHLDRFFNMLEKTGWTMSFMLGTASRQFPLLDLDFHGPEEARFRHLFTDEASKDAPSVGFCSSSRSPTSSRKFSVHFLT